MISQELKQQVKVALGDVVGKCYIASEALYYLAGGKSAGIKPVVGRVPNSDTTHWWLKDEDGSVVDLTFEQFSFPFPYETGRGCGFQVNMKKETKELLEVINGHRKHG